MNIKSVEINSLVLMFIIAMGKQIGLGFTYIPKLPTPFSKNLDFQNSCGCNADFVCLRVSSEGEVECWFYDGDNGTFSYTLDEIRKMQPMLWVSIITHVCDMIENL